MSDYEGDWAHIVVGALVGGITGFATELAIGATVSDALISATFGATSGALCAVFPTLSVAIDAVVSATESLTDSFLEKKDVASTICDVVVSVGFSLLTCGIGNTLSEKSTYQALKAGKDAIASAYRPMLEKSAKKQFQKTLIETGKATASEFAEYLTVFLMERGSRWYLENKFALMLL